jgi:hypothetical protein
MGSLRKPAPPRIYRFCQTVDTRFAEPPTSVLAVEGRGRRDDQWCFALDRDGADNGLSRTSRIRWPALAGNDMISLLSFVFGQLGSRPVWAFPCFQ